MKHLFLLLCIGVLSLHATAQNTLKAKDLIGTWKVEVISDNSNNLYLNIAKDSMHIADAFRATWKSGEDSAMAVMAVQMLGNMLKEMEMEFKEGNVFIERVGDKSKSGTYTLDTTTGLLTTNTKRKETLKASLQNGMLRLEQETEGGNDMVMHLRKQ